MGKVWEEGHGTPLHRHPGPPLPSKWSSVWWSSNKSGKNPFWRLLDDKKLLPNAVCFMSEQLFLTHQKRVPFVTILPAVWKTPGGGMKWRAMSRSPPGNCFYAFTTHTHTRKCKHVGSPTVTSPRSHSVEWQRDEPHVNAPAHKSSENSWSYQLESSSAAGKSHILIQKLKRVKRHHGRRVSTQPSIPPHRVLLTELQPFALTFFLHRKAISCCSVTLAPPTSDPLSLPLSRLIQDIVRSRSNPNLQGSLTGAPFNCFVQAVAS